MKKLLFLSLVLFSTCIFISCHSNSNMQKPAPSVSSEMDAEGSTWERKDIPVDIVFEEWHFQHDINGNNMGLIDSISVTLSGINQSGKAVEAKTSLYVGGAMYQPDLFRMLGKLGNEGLTKNGVTGSGKLNILELEYPRNPNLFIEQVGDMATEFMEFNIPQDAVAVFKK